MEYLIVKWLHIVSSTFLFGTGIGTAFYLFFISLGRNVAAVAVVTRHVVAADWLFTATSVVVQPLTGFYLVQLAGFPLSSRWLTWSIALYGIAVACWLPVIGLQIRMRRLAATALEQEAALPPAYWRCFGWWTLLGIPALLALLAVFWLMVAKPG